MNIVKTSVALFAIAAMTSVFAKDVETQGEVRESSSEGWSPVALGIATPVQLPWGIDRWDIYGLDLNIFYSDAPDVYGIQVGLGNTVRNELRGIGIAGLFNYADKDVFGVRCALGGNVSKGTLYGVDFGGFGYHNDLVGADFELVTCVQRNITGANFSLLGSFTENMSYGATFGAINLAKVAYGAQVALAYNQCEELHGCQIGLVNYCRECPWGFQIGVVNIILDNKVKVLPVVNGYF